MDETLAAFGESLKRALALVRRLRCERDQLLGAIRKLDEANREARVLCLGTELNDALLLVDWIEGGGSP